LNTTTFLFRGRHPNITFFNSVSDLLLTLQKQSNTSLINEFRAAGLFFSEKTTSGIG